MEENRQKSSADSRREDTHFTDFTDAEMELKQVLVFLLSLVVCVCKHPCYKEEDLESAARKKLNSHYLQPTLPNQASSVSSVCPLEMFGKGVKDRSISPWAYVQRHMPEHFPSTYYEARCLCEGCVVFDDEGIAYETHNYNSAPVVQSRVFLKREQCEDSSEGKRYHLIPVSVNVTVACTCVRVLY